MHMEQATYNESSILVFYTRIDMQLHNVFIILGTHYFSLSGKTSYERKQKQAKILCSLLNHALFCLGAGGGGRGGEDHSHAGSSQPPISIPRP